MQIYFMRQALKNVLLALLALYTLVASNQPSILAIAWAEKSASTLLQGQSEAVVSDSIAINIDTIFVSGLKPEIKKATYEDKVKLLASLRSVDHLLEVKDKTLFASAKKNEVEQIQSEIAIVEPEVKNVLNGEIEVKGETTEVDYALNSEILFNMVNEHRIRIGIPALIKDDSLMQLAIVRAPELFDEIFVNGNMHSGFYARANSLGYYATENIIYNQSESGALNWWLNSPIHRAAIENATHTHTGIACSGKTCAMIYTHFQAK